jgi:hypothetical protein
MRRSNLEEFADKKKAVDPACPVVPFQAEG